MFDFPIELQRTNELLERLVMVAERAFPPAIPPKAKYIRGPEAVLDLSGKAVDERRRVADWIEDKGLSPEDSAELQKAYDRLDDTLKQHFLGGI